MKKYFFAFLGFLSLEVVAQQIEYSRFEGINIQNVCLNVRLIEPFFSEYSLSNTDAKYLKIHKDSYHRLEDVERKISDLYSKREDVYDTSQNYLGLVHKFSFQWAGTKTVIVKYFEIKDNTLIRYDSFLFQEANSDWKIVKLPEISDIVFAITHLKSQFFWEFYNKSESKFSTINEYKQRVRDSDSILNIVELGRLISANKKLFAEFCDF